MKYISRALYILIFLVMVTSPYAGHTYAEYARESSGSDMARASKFGVTVTATQSTFAVSYGETVASGNGEKIIAPGTDGTFVAFSASGTPEVATRITKNATVTMSDGWETYEGDFYCPLTFTVKNNLGTVLNTINGLDYSDRASLVEALTEELTADNGKEYDPKYNFRNNDNHNRTITWEWPYIDATGDSINQTEPHDNSLGEKHPTISVSFDITIEQIDNFTTPPRNQTVIPIAFSLRRRCHRR